MRVDEQIRYWKDADYRESLPADGVAGAGPNPAGAVEIDDADLASAVGASTEWLFSLGCCGGFTQHCEGLTGQYCSYFCTPTIWMTTDRICGET